MLVDHRDPLGLQVRHRAGDQVLHRAHLVRGRLSRADADGHGGGGLLGSVLEQLPLGQYEVHAGEGDAVAGADGARQLAFGGALHIQLLDESVWPRRFWLSKIS